MLNLKEIFIDRDFQDLRFNELMSKHTTFKIGGPADLLIRTKSEDEVIKAINLCKKHNIKYFILGNGSNILVKDTGIRGVVIKIGSGFDKISIEGNIVYAQAGALLSTISKKVLKEELTGFEFASGIPGTVGGAMMMNAGAYGGEMKDVVRRVKLVDEKGNIEFVENKDMNFRYRASKVKDDNLIVLGAEFYLEKGRFEDIKERMDDLTQRRTSKQPLEYASAGSTFKRPEGYYAGKLISDSGLRGIIHGNAQVSEKHCGFVINRGDSNFKEVTELIAMIQKTVRDKYGVELEREVKIIGD